MSKLVDRERLARLAQALDARMKAAVAAEKEERMAADAGLQQAINAINDANNGILKQAKDYADQQKGLCDQAMVDHKAAQALVDAEQDARLQTLEGLVVGGEGEGLSAVIADVAKNKADIVQLNTDVANAQADADANADAIAKEIEDREAAVQGLDTRVKAIEDNMAGDIEAAVQELANRHDQEMDDVEDRVGANEEAIAALEAKFGEGEGTVGDMIADAVKVVQDDLDAFEIAQAAKEEEQDGRLNALEAKFAGDGSVDAKIAAAEAAAKKHADDQDAALEGRVNGKFDAVNAAAEALAGRVAANEAFVAAQEGKDQANLQAAKDYADQQITALVNGAPDAMNTLNELAEAIADHQDVYDAYVEEVSGKVAAAEQNAKNYADTQDEALEAKINQKIADDVKAEADRADAAEKALAADIAAINNEENGILAQAKADAANKVKAEEERAMAAEKLLDDAIKALSGEQGAEAKAKAYTDAEILKAKSEMSAEIDADVKAEADRAKGEEARIEGKVDAIAGQLDNEGGLVDRLEAAEAFIKEHDHAVMQGEIDALEGRADALEAFVEAHDHTVMEKGIADNKAAIEQEAKDRDAAIAEALKDFTNTADMKVMLGNVVNSLALTMEDNKMMLKLGGVEGITIHETSLDMATDDDIDAIIKGLDAE